MPFQFDGEDQAGLPILYRASLNFTSTRVNITSIYSNFVRVVSSVGEIFVVQEVPSNAGVIGFQASGKLHSTVGLEWMLGL